jgi:hypothetical protein
MNETIEIIVAVIAAPAATLAIFLLLDARETLKAAEAAEIVATELASRASSLASRASSMERSASWLAERASSLAARASAKLSAFSSDSRLDS